MDPWIPTNISGSDQVLRKVPGTYGGYSLRETSGLPATVTLYDNATSATGAVLEYITLGAGESTREEYKRGVRALNGIFVAVTGAVSGSVRTN